MQLQNPKLLPHPRKTLPNKTRKNQTTRRLHRTTQKRNHSSRRKNQRTKKLTKQKQTQPLLFLPTANLLLRNVFRSGRIRSRLF